MDQRHCWNSLPAPAPAVMQRRSGTHGKAEPMERYPERSGCGARHLLEVCVREFEHTLLGATDALGSCFLRRQQVVTLTVDVFRLLVRAALHVTPKGTRIVSVETHASIDSQFDQGIGDCRSYPSLLVLLRRAELSLSL